MTSDSVARLLLRFLLVPLGYCAAAIAGTAVIVGSSLQLFEAALSGHPDGPVYALYGFIIGGWIVGIFVIVFMFLPASIGILISEAFGIRSWIYHALNGVVAAWVGAQLYGSAIADGLPLTLVAAGLAGGFAYWAVAGFSAGFWKPVFRLPAAAEPAIPR